MELFRKLFGQYMGLRKENYVLFFGRIVTNMGSMIYPVLTLILSQKLGLNATDIAMVTVISGVAFLPAGIIGGRLADRYNKKNIIIVCDIISVILFIICGIIPLTFKSIVLLLTAAAFQNVEQPSYNALIADITTTDNRERAYSLMYLGGNLGLVASPMIAGLLFKNYLWLSFIISGVAILCSTILIFFEVKDITRVVEVEQKAEYQEDAQGVSLWRILLDKKTILLYVLVNALYSSVYSQYGYMMPLDIGRVHGGDGALIFGSVSSLNCIEVVIFTPIITKIFAKMCHTKKNLVGVAGTLMGYVCFLVFLGHIPFYYMAMTLFTLGEVFGTLANGPYLSSRVPASHRGRINGLQTFLQNFLYGVLMLVLGMIYDNFGNVSAWILVFVLLGIAILGSMILIPVDRKVYHKLYE